MNARSRTILLITFILTIFSVSILAVMQIQQEKEVKILKDKYFQNAKSSYSKISTKYETYYDEIILNIFNNGFKQSFKDKNKEQSYKYFLDNYTNLRKQNTNLLGVSFYTPDNKLFLDMNNLSKSVKNSLYVKLVNKTQKNVFSAFSDGKSVVFKSIHPIFYSNEYLGCIELEISSKYILDDMKKYTGVDGFIFSSSSSALVYNTTKNMLLLNGIKKNAPTNTQYELKTRKGEVYSTYVFSLNDNMSLNIADIYFFNNITKEAQRLEENLFQISMFLLVMVLITILIVGVGVGKSLEKLQSSYDDLYEYTDMIDDNIMIVDTAKDGIITGASKRFCDVSGYSQDDLIGKSFRALKEDSVNKKVYEDIEKALLKDGKWSGDLHNTNKAGTGYWLSAVIEKKEKDNKFVCYNYIMHNITDKKISEELVHIDVLTSLYNRNYFNDIFPRMVNGIKRNGGCLNFIVLDVDGFAKFNEEYGAQVADEALVKIGNKLVESLRRPDDYCFRLGGGEFAILFRSGSEDEGLMYTKVLRKNIEMLGIKNKTNIKFKVLTASFGLASFIFERIIDEEDVYKTAYVHLRRAKEDGKNKVVHNLV